MKYLNQLLISIMGILFVHGCFITNKAVQVHITNCHFCDSLNKNLRTLDYPYREIDKNITGLPLAPSDTIQYKLTKKKDTMQVLTKQEVENINKLFFCFLGKSEKDVDEYFPTEMGRINFQERNQHTIVRHYDYILGAYYKNGVINDDTNGLDKKLYEFWIVGFHSFSMYFTLINKQYIYSGTRQDSTNLIKCFSIKK